MRTDGGILIAALAVAVGWALVTYLGIVLGHR